MDVMLRRVVIPLPSILVYQEPTTKTSFTKRAALVNAIVRDAIILSIDTEDSNFHAINVDNDARVLALQIFHVCDFVFAHRMMIYRSVFMKRSERKGSEHRVIVDII